MDFRFVHTPDFRKWIVLAPRRSNRPDVAKGTEHSCPFCPGSEENDQELYRIGSSGSDWTLRIIPNKFPFAPVHELIIHSPDHHKNIDELPFEYVRNLLTVYRERYQLHQDKGQVFIFHNRGIQAGESIPHAHTQLTLVPTDVQLEATLLVEEDDPTKRIVSGRHEQIGLKTKCFRIFSPKVSQWPDEVWIAPLRSGKRFGQIDDNEIADLAYCLPRLIQIMNLRHGDEFPFNYMIFPGVNWYLRLVPRQKSLGGFEVGTGVYVNTLDPEETNAFLVKYFHDSKIPILPPEHRANYPKHV